MIYGTEQSSFWSGCPHCWHRAKDGMASPDSFELPTCWFEAVNLRRISSVATPCSFAIDCYMLLIAKQFLVEKVRTVSTVGNASMHGVGTELGTV